mgnify:FL=1
MDDSTTSAFSGGPGDWSGLNISWNRVALLRDMGQAERALAEAGRVCAAFPDIALVHLLLAICLCDVGRVDEAREEGFEALRLDPNEVQALRLCAQLAWTPVESRDLLRRAVGLDPHDGRTLADLAVAEQQTGLHSRRWRELERLALEAAPEDPDVLMAAARLEGWISTRKSQKFLHRAMALDPNNPNALSDLSWMATSVRQIHEAGKALSAALAASPTNPVLNRTADSLILRIHRSVVPFSIMAEAITAVMSRSLGYDPNLNTKAIFLSSWGMFGMVMAIISVPTLLGLGPRTAMFMRAFYGNRPVERALMRTTLILVPIQLGVILATGDPDAIGASAALSLVITTGVFAYQKHTVKRRRAREPAVGGVG